MTLLMLGVTPRLIVWSMYLSAFIAALGCTAYCWSELMSLSSLLILFVIYASADYNENYLLIFIQLQCIVFALSLFKIPRPNRYLNVQG